MLYCLKKTFTVAGSHHLPLDYVSPCRNVHGHNWKVTVEVEAEELNSNGMVVDFAKLKKVVMALDHQDLNFFVPIPTAENLAAYIADNVMTLLLVENPKASVSAVTVVESEGAELCVIL